MVTTVPPPSRRAPARPAPDRPGAAPVGTQGPRAGRGLLAGVAAGCLLAGLGAGLVVAGRAPADTGEPVAAHPTATVTVTAHPRHGVAGVAGVAGHAGAARSGHRDAARPGHAGRPRTTIPGDGTFRVGTDVQPGLYAAQPERTICYWSRLHDLRGRLGSIAANGVSRGRAVLRVEPDDRYVQTSGCTTWHRL